MRASTFSARACVRCSGRASEAGSGFVFGYLGGAPLPFEEHTPGAGFVLAFRALPLILVLSALTALLTHWRVLPALVRALAAGLRHSLGIGAATGLGVAANVFLGMVEAPLFIRPWLARLSRSELFVLMTAGMATIAGTVMVLYASVLGDAVPGAAGHLLTASIISAPAAVAVALVMVPETEPPTDAATVALGERGRVIMTYALCGFANPGSLGILVGGLSALVPERRAEIVGLGLRSVLSGTLATCSTGAVVALAGA
jgi:nucleoside permease NupC